MKICKACHESLPLEAFYAQALNSDGRTGKCMECTRAERTAYRALHADRIRAKDRERSKLPHRRQNNSRVTKAWVRRHPKRINAHKMAQRYNPHPPACCQMCGFPKKLERHHPDYQLPTLISWLCKPCHIIADRVRREKETPTKCPTSSST